MFPTEDQLYMNFLRRYAPPSAGAVDVFAGDGFHSVDLSKVVYPGVVHSFEPNRTNFQRANANAFLNSRTNMKTYNMSIGCVERKIKVQHMEDGDEEDIAEVPLDSLNLEKIGTMRISSENPADILSGAINTIRESEPFIMLTGISTSGPAHFADVEDVMFAQGYHKMALTNSIYYIPRRLHNIKRVAIVCAVRDIQWDATNVQHLGFGEAEQAVVNLAEYLAQEGYLVDVWCAPVQKSRPKTNPRYLEYRHFREFFEMSKYYNSVVWWRYPGEVTLKRKSSTNILWMLDFMPGSIEPGVVDKVVFSSDHHRDTILSKIDNLDHRAAVRQLGRRRQRPGWRPSCGSWRCPAGCTARPGRRR